MNKQETNQTFYQHYHKGNGVGAIFLILLGITLLLNNLEILPWSIWDTLIKYWPVLLIIWGLQFALGNRRVINSILTILGLSFAFLIITIYTASINPNFYDWLVQKLPNFQPENFYFLIR